MQIKRVILIVAILGASVLLAKVKTPGLEEVVAKLEENYRQIKTYSARFEQEVRNQQFGRLLSRGQGELYYSKPGKMVWHYTEPEEHWYITNGKTFWDYLPSVKQVLVMSVDEALSSNIPKSFLFGMGELKKDFDISFDPNSSQPSAGLFSLKLVPKKERDRLILGTIILKVDDKSFLVKEASLIDQLGNENILRFKDIKVNPKIDEKIFEFKVPEGVEVIHPPKEKSIENLEKKSSSNKNPKEKKDE